MIIQQMHAATTTRHSYTLMYQFFLLISRCLTRPRFASRYIFSWTSLARYPAVFAHTGDEARTLHAESGRGNHKIFGCASRSSG